MKEFAEKLKKQATAMRGAEEKRDRAAQLLKEAEREFNEAGLTFEAENVRNVLKRMWYRERL